MENPTCLAGAVAPALAPAVALAFIPAVGQTLPGCAVSGTGAPVPGPVGSGLGRRLGRVESNNSADVAAPMPTRHDPGQQESLKLAGRAHRPRFRSRVRAVADRGR